MKILTVFWKNLRTISRNPNYFLVLFVCPIILIALAAFLLNSVDYNNISVGVVEGEKIPDEIYKVISKPVRVESLESCLNKISSSEINICISLNNNGRENRELIVYFDNSKRLIEYYSRQMILSNLFDQQNTKIEKTAEVLSSKIGFYSASLTNLSLELNEAEKELNTQERVIKEYRKNLSDTRKKVDETHASLKSVEPTINDLESFSKSNGSQRIKEAIDKKESIDRNISILRSFLMVQLPGDKYIQAEKQLNSITSELDLLENDLRTIDKIYNSGDMDKIILAYRSALKDLEQTSLLLESIDVEINKALLSIEKSKTKISNFRKSIDLGKNDLKGINGTINQQSLEVSFKNAFSITEDPIYVVFPLLVVIIISFSSIILSNMFILKQLSEQSYLRDLISPTSRSWFVLGAYLTNLFFVSIQIVALFLFGALYFKFYSVDLFLPYFLIMLLGATVFVFIGMIIAYSIRSQAISTIISLFSLLVFFIMSDFLAPVSIAGGIARIIVNINPFYLIQKMVFDLMILEDSLSKMINPLLILSIWILIGLVATYISRKLSEKKALD